MSYLSTPRLQFAGQFQADPSTVNNDPEHFNTKTFQTNFQEYGSGASNGWWNPKGTGAWRLVGCTVQRVYYNDGTWCDDPTLDPIIGMSITGADRRVEGKIVDLDSENQSVSQLWGFQVLLNPGGPGISFQSDFEVAAFGDLWGRCLTGGGDERYAALYQSQLHIKKWVNDGSSRYLTELAKTFNGNDAVGSSLSIKFNIDGFMMDVSQPASFTIGRISGAIGPVAATSAPFPAEPKHFVYGRTLTPTSGPMAYNYAYAQIVGNNLYVDLGNSLTTLTPGGPFQDQGRLHLAIMPATGDPQVIGEIRYLDCDWYNKTAGISCFTLTDDQLYSAQRNPLAILSVGPFGGPLFLEASNGYSVRADEYVFRVDPPAKEGDPATQISTTFYATAFGSPLPNVKVYTILDPSILIAYVYQGPIPGPTKVNTPADAFTFPAYVTTTTNGTVDLPISVKDPGNPRGYIDGQVYAISYQIGSAPAIGAIQNGNQLISALVFSRYTPPNKPNWLMDVQPIFQQYADLYPVMKPIVDLGNYASVRQKRYILQNVFNADISDPNYMPVTRDLSTAKRNMLIQWLQDDELTYMDLSSVDDLKKALQIAIELEHSTIPPYLTALYSIKPGANQEVAALINSVVMEEMLHMAQASNILIAIGGTPTLNNADFIPAYPGPLPGGLRADLTVNLKRCSIEQVRDCFMSIEEPEDPLKVKLKLLFPQLFNKPQQNTIAQKGVGPQQLPIETVYTIGWFYDEIKDALKLLSQQGKLTFGNTADQITEWRGTGILHLVTDLDSALAGIDEIKEQGEGNNQDPYDADAELAHYYKFAEIVHGKRLVQVGETYLYAGATIPFDPAGVWPTTDNPRLVNFPDGSKAKLLALRFANTYQSLLNALNTTFNSTAAYNKLPVSDQSQMTQTQFKTKCLHEAIGIMFSMQIQAQDLVQTPSGNNDGLTAGPVFQIAQPMIPGE